jgi:hypothetical protein
MTESIHADSAFYVRFNKGYDLMEKHPEHVPVMFETTKTVPLEKDTIMCLREAPLSNVILQFRKYLTADNNSPAAGFIFSIKHEDKDILPRLSERMGDLHDKYHGPDMWLVLKINKEDIFG